MSGGIAVRAYRVEDEEAVVALWADVFGYEQARNNPLLDVRRKRDAQPEFFLLAEEGGRVVGTVMGGYDGHRGWAHRLAVAPAQRRRGIGEALMRRLEAELDVAGCPKLNLQVRASATRWKTASAWARSFRARRSRQPHVAGGEGLQR
jgi:ribosomal protein S18 acetylase RimI-like enzyme